MPCGKGKGPETARCLQEKEPPCPEPCNPMRMEGSLDLQLRESRERYNTELIRYEQSQLDYHRNKYLEAQQVVEQRRSIDMMQMENNYIAERVNLEIRFQNQLQEKLQEVTQLPDILEATQIKLQEAQQMLLLAERNNVALVRELQAFRDKAAAMANQMEKVRRDHQLGADERATLQQRADEFERKCNELQEECDTLETDLARMEEVAEQNEKGVQEKFHEIPQPMAQLEIVREESARQVARTKDRCETVGRSIQNQIADLKRQLAQSRAQARQAQKDRDEIRQKMQSQINNLNENVEDVQMRIRNFQGQGDMGSERGSTFKYDPNIDASVLRELEDAEQQAMATEKIIDELKERVAQLLSTPKMTEVQARELEEKNHQLREQMQLFEEETKLMQFLIEQRNLFENMLMPKPALQGKHKEDMLPKVIICVTTESNMTKIIVCDDKKKKDGRKSSAGLPPATVSSRDSESVIKIQQALKEQQDVNSRLRALNF